MLGSKTQIFCSDSMDASWSVCGHCIRCLRMLHEWLDIAMRKTADYLYGKSSEKRNLLVTCTVCTILCTYICNSGSPISPTPSWHTYTAETLPIHMVASLDDGRSADRSWGLRRIVDTPEGVAVMNATGAQPACKQNCFRGLHIQISAYGMDYAFTNAHLTG